MKYIEKDKVLNIIGNMQDEHHYDAANLEDRYVVAHLLEVADKIKELPSIDIQTLIQARLRGIQQIKLDALKSSDLNTAYKMKGAEEVCNAILADLSETTKG